MDKPDKITTEFIIGSLQALVEAGKSFDPSVWINSAFKLNILLMDEVDKMLDLEQQVAKMRHEYIEKQDKKNKAAADAFVESTDEYRAMRRQEELIEVIKEQIRLAKKQSDRHAGQ